MVLIQRTPTVFFAILLLFTGLPSVACAEQSDTMITSVGRLLIPAVRYQNGYVRHYDERCSGTVVTEPGGSHSTVVISAWHCLEDYRDLSRPLIFETIDGRRSEVRLLASGGSMEQDWALLRLAEAQAALPIDDAGIPSTVTMVGFPRASASSAQTQVRCSLMGLDGADYRGGCALKPGASGGGVISTDGQQYLGVVSRGDGVTQSIFVPVERFRQALRAHF